MVWERRCRQRAMAVQNLPVAAAVAAAVVREWNIGICPSGREWQIVRSSTTIDARIA